MHIEFNMVLHSAGSVNLCESIRNYLMQRIFKSKTATNTHPLASQEALSPIEEPKHWLRVVEMFCKFVEKAEGFYLDPIRGIIHFIRPHKCSKFCLSSTFLQLDFD